MELLSPPDRKIERKKKNLEEPISKSESPKFKRPLLKGQNLHLYTLTFHSEILNEEWRIKMVAVLNQLSLPSPIQKWDNVSNFVQKREGIKRKDTFSPFFFLFLSKSDSPSHDASVDTYVYIQAQTYIYTRDIFLFPYMKNNF